MCFVEIGVNCEVEGFNWVVSGCQRQRFGAMRRLWHCSNGDSSEESAAAIRNSEMAVVLQRSGDNFEESAVAITGSEAAARCPRQLWQIRCLSTIAFSARVRSLACHHP